MLPKGPWASLPTQPRATVSDPGGRGGAGREEEQDPEGSWQGLLGAQGGAAPVHACPPGPRDTRAALTLTAGSLPRAKPSVAPRARPRPWLT